MTSSDSDSFPSSKKNVNAKEEIDSTDKGVINQDKSMGSKESFQQMLMNSNNKLKEMLKNKFKTGVNDVSQFKKRNSYIEFSPGASSTKVGNMLNQNSALDKYQMDSDDVGNENSEKSIEVKKSKHKQNKLSKISENNNTTLNSEDETDGLKSKNQDNLNLFKKIKRKHKETISSSDSSDTAEKTNNMYTNIEHTYDNKEKHNLSLKKEHRSKKNKNINRTHKEGLNEDSDSTMTISNTKTLYKNVNNTSVLNIKHSTNLEGEYENSLFNSDDENKSSNLLSKINKGKLKGSKSKTKHQSSESLNDFVKNNLVPSLSKTKPVNLEQTVESDFEFSKDTKLEKYKAIETSGELSLSGKSFKTESQLKKFEKLKSASRIEDSHNFISTRKSKQEVFIIQIPKKFDATELIGTSISLSKVTRVPQNTRKYDCIATPTSEESIAISCNTNDVCLIKLSGNIKIQKHLKKKQMPDFSEAHSSSVAFPNTLKQRHPLFGSEYEDKINLEEHIQEKLRLAIKKHYKDKKKKEKVKNKNPEQEEEIFEILSQKVGVSKKNKKTKNVAEDEAGTKRKYVDEEDDNCKKKRHEIDSTFDNSSNLIDDLLSTNYTEISSTKQKKKKKKHQE